jgi:FKBP-type peptidyl-prolyl cis-trans isomerase
MKSALFLLPLAIVCLVALESCSRGADSPSSPESTPLPVPRTVDRGDGCQVEITRDGDGAIARIGDEVSLRCDTRLKDSESKLASTEEWIAPLRVRLGDPSVLPGLSRGLEGLGAGTCARIEVPPSLAYGSAGNPAAGIPSDATLVLDVEILGVRPR